MVLTTMGLRSYIAMRILLMIPMIMFLISIVFLIVRVLPGDPVLLHFEKKATEEQLQAMRVALGLDVPIWVQYINYVVGFFSGDLGKSMQDFSPVGPTIFSAFPATLELAIFAIAIAVLIGVLLGSKSAESYNKPVDHLFRLSGIVSYAIPVFFLGMIFQLILCVGLGLFPVGGRFNPGGEPQGLNLSLSMTDLGFALGFILPSLILVLPFVVSFLMSRKWHALPKTIDFLFVFIAFVASTILYAILAVFIPNILAAPLVGLIPLVVVLMLLIQRRGRFLTQDLKVLIPLFVVSFLVYGFAAGIMPLLLLSYFVGLLPAYVFLRMTKKRGIESQKINLLGMLEVLSILWVQMLLAVIIASMPTYGIAGDPMTLLVSYYLAGLILSLMYLGTLAKRKMSLHTKNLLTSLVMLSVVWFIFLLGGWSSISAGGLHVKTGLYTIDSILEGSIYDFVQSIRYIFLPALTLGIVLSGVFLRLTRTNMIETLRLDYVTAAKARGLKRRTVTYGYAFRNAFLPVLTMIGLQFAALLGGAVLTETTFSWPGLGRYIVDRINFRDYTAIQGAVVVFGVLVMIVSLIVDLLYAYLDPRIRL
jgi:ABC-type dipeptide/oligopeptide/nickel transport system permease component